MSAENQVAILKPAFIKDQFTIPQRKRKLLGTRTDTNRPISKIPVARGCYNCSHELSKYYYWKPSPCEKCIRNPSNSYWSLKVELTDQWERLSRMSFSVKNHLS